MASGLLGGVLLGTFNLLPASLLHRIAIDRHARAAPAGDGVGTWERIPVYVESDVHFDMLPAFSADPDRSVMVLEIGLPWRWRIEQHAWSRSGSESVVVVRRWGPLAKNLGVGALAAASIAAVPMLIVGTRRRLRLGRGLCPRCAYRCGSSPTCTECGRVHDAPTS